ncbi:site-2 protease family protein [Clostridium peptidivorans]|uniref:site-2 protease family protein n=1 Tax=Clostridium peptidivorans TaxID=100174 RepID=UPI000BE34D27|nr:site-2 protease family protein [Clostridium peptidivorans]
MEITILFIFMYVSIFLHELGHFLASKIFNVNVLDFSIGCGPSFCKFKFRGTKFSFKLLPLRGYISYSEDEVLKLSILKDWIISLSGVCINFLIAILSLSLAFNRNIFEVGKIFFTKILIPITSFMVNFDNYFGADMSLKNSLSLMPDLTSSSDLWLLLACINLCLCIFNLLPIPILDGGQIIMTIIKRLSRRLGIPKKYFDKVVNIVYAICWVLIISPLFINGFLAAENQVVFFIYIIMGVLTAYLILLLKQTDIYKKTLKRT